MRGDRANASMAKPDLDPGAAARLSGWLRDYRTLPGVPDELLDPSGRPRSHWLGLLAEFADFTEAEFQNRFSLAARHIRDTGVSYRIYGEETERSWPLGPLPLILTDQDWSQIVEGVTQRARLMSAIAADIYGAGALTASGALPAAAVTGSPDFLRSMCGVPPPGGNHLQLYAADVGRGPDGRWWVLDDRAQAPSGLGYALENRLVLSRAFPNLYGAMNVQRLAGFFDDFRKGLAATALRVEPRICLLTPGPFSETYFEQAHLARYLGLLLVEGEDLVVRGGRVFVRTIEGLKRIDVILRRVDADFIDPLELNGASHLGVPGLMDAVRRSEVAVVNIPGAGVLESKALLGFMPALCRQLLGEDLKMPNVATWWCGQPEAQDFVRGRLNDLVIASAFTETPGETAFGRPRLMADLDATGRAALAQRLEDRPCDVVGQEVVRLSTTPVLRDGQLKAAPFILRVYAAWTPDGIRIMPGGFCRTSIHADARAISMGEGAQSADVWVISDRPVERITLLANKDDVKVRRIPGRLPSRAADHLFWLGRYMERAESTLRMVRSLCSSLMDAEQSAHASGETLTAVQKLLIDWGALDEEALGEAATTAARDALHDVTAEGAVITLVRAVKRTASGMRERLSSDFWSLLLQLEASLAGGARTVVTEADALSQTEDALQRLSALSGLCHENMNRGAGWRFLDLGRRLERAINTSQFVRTLAGPDATVDALDLLLDLADSQITYRARYLVGLALTPAVDMVVLDPFNPRSVGFQIFAIRDHLAAMPTLVADGMLEAPLRQTHALATRLEIADAAVLDTAWILEVEQNLLQLSNAIADRYFLQGANAAPTAKLAGLA